MFEKKKDDEKGRNSVHVKPYAKNFLATLVPDLEASANNNLGASNDTDLADSNNISQTERKRGNSFVDRLSVFSQRSTAPVPKKTESDINTPVQSYIKVLDEASGKTKWVQDEETASTARKSAEIGEAKDSLKEINREDNDRLMYNRISNI